MKLTKIHIIIIAIIIAIISYFLYKLIRKNAEKRAQIALVGMNVWDSIVTDRFGHFFRFYSLSELFEIKRIAIKYTETKKLSQEENATLYQYLKRSE